MPPGAGRVRAGGDAAAGGLTKGCVLTGVGLCPLVPDEYELGVMQPRVG